MTQDTKQRRRFPGDVLDVREEVRHSEKANLRLELAESSAYVLTDGSVYPLR